MNSTPSPTFAIPDVEEEASETKKKASKPKELYDYEDSKTHKLETLEDLALRSDMRHSVLKGTRDPPFQGLVIRTLALIFDIGIILPITFVLSYSLIFLNLYDPVMGTLYEILYFGILFHPNQFLFFPVFFIYKVVMEASVYEGTFGKHLLDIKITNAQGQRIDITSSFIRAVLWPTALLFILWTAIVKGIILYTVRAVIGFLPIEQVLGFKVPSSLINQSTSKFRNTVRAFTEDGQAFHDVVARTYVIVGEWEGHLPVEETDSFGA